MSPTATILVTGAAGFAGLSVCGALARQGYRLVGTVRHVDPHNPRTKLLHDLGVSLRTVNLTNSSELGSVIKETEPEVIVHLAAQASPQGGNLSDYVSNNVGAFANITQAGTQYGAKHIIYASSYGVYSAVNPCPQREDMAIAPPTNLYAVTKYADELLAQTLPPHSPAMTGLRFFNLYGPWQRPDTMPSFFAKKLLAREAVPLFADGNLVRDFIEVGDAAEAVSRLVSRPAQGHRLFNVGSGEGVTVKSFVEHLAAALGVDATIDPKPHRAIDIPASYADISAITTATGWTPNTHLADGLARFSHWFKKNT